VREGLPVRASSASASVAARTPALTPSQRSGSDSHNGERAQQVEVLGPEAELARLVDLFTRPRQLCRGAREHDRAALLKVAPDALGRGDPADPCSAASHASGPRTLAECGPPASDGCRLAPVSVEERPAPRQRYTGRAGRALDACPRLGQHRAQDLFHLNEVALVTD
jgi:hypothetical protein